MRESILARFQTDFAAALLGEPRDLDPRVAALVAQPAFAVYRNGVMKSAADALACNYPAIARLVGEEWLRAAACEFVRHSPPLSPMLVEYGASFADFLADFEPAADLPYLPAVARLDRLWTESHIAADAEPLDGSILRQLAPQELAAMHLQPHPAARWIWFEAMPAYTLWSRNRSDVPFDGDIDWQSEGALLTRPSSAVVWSQIGRAECAFLDACRDGASLEQAAHAATEADPQTDLARLMQTIVAAGAVCDPRAPQDSAALT